MLNKEEREWRRTLAQNWACGPGLVNDLIDDIDELHRMLATLVPGSATQTHHLFHGECFDGGHSDGNGDPECEACRSIVAIRKVLEC